MIDKATYDELSAQLSHSEKLQEQMIRTLWGTTPPRHLVDKSRQLIGEMKAAIEAAKNESIQQSAHIINHRDEGYTFRRAIDGDTISVEPPSELRQWMIDIRIRLFGIDTPEMDQEWGEAYQRLVSRLFEEVAGKSLSVIWERETDDTQYPGFPRGSFERAVGNVFIRLDDSRLLYVNAFLGMLPHVKPIKIRDRKRVPLPTQQNSPVFGCSCRLGDEVLSVLDELAPLKPAGERQFPLCLCTVPKEIVTISTRSPLELWGMVLESIGGYSCPYADMIDLIEFAGIEDRII